MKITLEFDPVEERHLANCAVHGFTLWSALWDIDAHCRNRMKHGDDVTDKEYETLERVREMCTIAHFVEEEL